MIKKKIDNYLSKIVNRSLEKLHFQNGCSALNLSRYNYKNVKKIIETDLKIYSQNGEDGIIDYLLFSLNIEKPKFIEIGVGDYSESNTRFFFERTSGDGLIIDIIDDFEKKVKEKVKIWKGNLKILQQNIDANNILDTLKNNNFFQKIDLFSLDIDGIDYWVLKELPKNFCKILVAEYNPYFGDKFNLTSYEANILVSDKETSEYFEKVIKISDVKLATNWITVELFALLNSKDLEIVQSPISAINLSKLINLIKDGTISGKIAKSVFELMADGDKDPSVIVREKDLKQQSDPKELEKLIAKVINANLDKVKEYKSGKEKLFGFFVGQVMKDSGGKANPQLVNDILKKKLK